jgi:hypothetical protein
VLPVPWLELALVPLRQMAMAWQPQEIAPQRERPRLDSRLQTGSEPLLAP